MSLFTKFKKTIIYKILKKLKIVDTILFLVNKYNDLKRFSVNTLAKIRDLFITINIIVYCIFNKYPKKEPEREISLIVSLTSYPSRLKSIHITLFSILRQSLRANKIILWLDKEECKGYKFSKLLNALSLRGITIEWVEVNLRSFNKLLPTLKKYPNANIVICDDDVIYPKNWLSELYQLHLSDKNILVGHTGLYFNKISDNKIESYDKIMQNASLDVHANNLQKYYTPNFNIMLGGIGGILFPPHSMPDEIHNIKNILALTPTADDIWFMGMSILNNKKSRVVNKPNFVPKSVSNTQNTGLVQINVGQQKNDEYIKNVFDFYDLYKYLS